MFGLGGVGIDGLHGRRIRVQVHDEPAPMTGRVVDVAVHSAADWWWVTLELENMTCTVSFQSSWIRWLEVLQEGV